MPFRRTVRHKKTVTKRKTFNRRGASNSMHNRQLAHKSSSPFRASPNQVTFIHRGILPYAPRYRCKFTTAIYGFIASGTITGQYSAYLNSCHIPFDSSLSPWPNSNPSYVTVQPSGYSSICNVNLYRNVRVLASKILIEFLPQALSDTIEVTVTPSNAAASPANTASAMSQPYTKSMFMSSSKMNSAKGSFISNYITQHKFLGVPSRALTDDLSGQFTHFYNGEPGIPLYWVVNWTTPDAVATTTSLEYRVKIVHYAECYNDTSANLLIT